MVQEGGGGGGGGECGGASVDAEAKDISRRGVGSVVRHSWAMLAVVTDYEVGGTPVMNEGHFEAEVIFGAEHSNM